MYMMILMVCTVKIHGDLPLMICKWLGFSGTGDQVTFSVVMLNKPLLWAKSRELYKSCYLCHLIFFCESKVRSNWVSFLQNKTIFLYTVSSILCWSIKEGFKILWRQYKGGWINRKYVFWPAKAKDSFFFSLEMFWFSLVSMYIWLLTL